MNIKAQSDQHGVNSGRGWQKHGIALSIARVISNDGLLHVLVQAPTAELMMTTTMTMALSTTVTITMVVMVTAEVSHTCSALRSSSMMMGPCMCLFRVSSVKGCTFCPVSRASCHKATSRSLAASASFFASATHHKQSQHRGTNIVPYTAIC